MNRLRWVAAYRDPAEKFFLKWWWPNINPSIVTVLSVLVAIGALFVLPNYWLFAVFILVNLFLDYADGMIAKKHGYASKKGYYIDLTADRISELILMSWHPLWFLFAILNVVLTFIGLRMHKNLAIMLRHLFFWYIIYLAIT